MPRYSGRVRVRTCQMQVWVLGPLGLPLTQYRSGLAGQGLATGLDSRLSGEAIPTPSFLTLGAGLRPLGWRGWGPTVHPGGHHVRAQGTGLRWTQPLKAESLYILSKSYGKDTAVHNSSG